MYLACKMEECPQHIRLITSEARSIWSDVFNLDTSKVGECEFWLISEMSSQMIVHQPYRTLESLKIVFSLSQDESNLVWSLINDTYMTDLPLLYAPHIICLTAILLSLVLRPQTATNIGQSMGSTPAANIASAAQAALTGLGQMTPANLADKSMANISPRSKLQKLSTWLAESNIDIEGIVDCTQEMISFYEVQEHYNEKVVKEQINRFVKARALDK